MAQKAKTVKLRGISSYAMVYSPDEYNDKRFWKINLHVTPETIQKVKDVGIQNKLKDDTGNIPNASGKFYSFKRDCEKEFSNGTTYFSPPVILDKDGKVLVKYKRDGRDCSFYTDGDRPDRIGEPVLIGNGSEVELELQVYQTKRFGKGARLEKIKILDLVEYNPPEDDEEENEEVEVTKEEAKQEEKKVEKTQKAKKDIGW